MPESSRGGGVYKLCNIVISCIMQSAEVSCKPFVIRLSPQSACEGGPEACPAVFPDVPGADPDVTTRPAGRQRHARVHTTGVSETLTFEGILQSI